MKAPQENSPPYKDIPNQFLKRVKELRQLRFVIALAFSGFLSTTALQSQNAPLQTWVPVSYKIPPDRLKSYDSLLIHFNTINSLISQKQFGKKEIDPGYLSMMAPNNIPIVASVEQTRRQLAALNKLGKGFGMCPDCAFYIQPPLSPHDAIQSTYISFKDRDNIRWILRKTTNEWEFQHITSHSQDKTEGYRNYDIYKTNSNPEINTRPHDFRFAPNVIKYPKYENYLPHRDIFPKL